MPAAFEDVQGAGDVALDVGVRVLERIAHAGLGGEVHDLVEALVREQVLDQRPVLQRAFDHAEVAMGREALGARTLERRVVIGVEIVEADDPVAALEQPQRA